MLLHNDYSMRLTWVSVQIWQLGGVANVGMTFLHAGCLVVVTADGYLRGENSGWYIKWFSDGTVGELITPSW